MKRTCAECLIAPTASRDGICNGCTLAIKDDDTGKRKDSRYNLDDSGRWVAGKHGVLHWVAWPPLRPVEAKPSARARPLPKVNTTRRFSDDECRDGRARYNQGDRSPETVAQNREYSRVAMAARRQRNKTRPREAA